MSTRIEKDSMGPLEVPAEAYYGVQTQRAVTNFPISGWPLPPRFVHAMGRIKRAAAKTNLDVASLRRGSHAGVKFLCAFASEIDANDSNPIAIVELGKIHSAPAARFGFDAALGVESLPFNSREGIEMADLGDAVSEEREGVLDPLFRHAVSSS